MKLKNDNQTSPTIAVSLIYFSLFGLFRGDGCRAIEADHILYCISIEPLLMDEQDDGEQKCKRPHSSDDVIMTCAITLVNIMIFWSKHGYQFIRLMLKLKGSNFNCKFSKLIDQIGVQ